MTANEYAPFRSEIRNVLKHTETEYTFRMAWHGNVRPGQFFEVSIPKYGEAPISVSGVGDDTIDLTIRRVGRVTDEVFERYKGDRLFLRGPYGNGFDVESMKGREIVVVAGGTGLSPVKGVIDHFCDRIDETKGVSLIAGFKSPADILFLEDFARWKKTIAVTLTVDCMGEEEFNPTCQVGLVTQHIGKLALRDRAEALAIVVGPPAMMKFSVQGLLDFGLREENILVSYERKMCCGIGKCGHCRIGDKYVCTDGPVFRWTEAKFLKD